MNMKTYSIYSRYTLSMLLVKYIVTLFLTYRVTRQIATSLMKCAIKANVKTITRILNGIYFGGETLNEARNAIDTLARHNISSVLDYAIEGEKNEKSFDESVFFTLRAIELASKNSHIPYVVIKPSALGSVDLYQARRNHRPSFEFYSPLWERLLERYDKIFSYAQKKSIPVMIDAEQSWIQATVNEIAIASMMKYNSEHALITMTLQCYRKDAYQHIIFMNTLAARQGINIGIKLVRGAYLEEEIKVNAHPYDMFFSSQSDTDKNYNMIANFILAHIDNFTPFFATHNVVSIDSILSNRSSLNKKVWFGQLYGVGDHISLLTVKKGGQVCKYLPYGPFSKSFPYLVRRIEENAVSRDTFRNENNILRKEMIYRIGWGKR